MGKLLHSTNALYCSCGSAPSTIIVNHPPAKIAGDTAIDATDAIVLPFGECSSAKHPEHEAFAEEGELPPCTPLPMGWQKTSTVVKINGHPAVHSGSKLLCVYGGSIKLFPTDPGSHVGLKE